MKVVIVTDHQGKLIGAYRGGEVKSGTTGPVFHGVTNSKQKHHERELPEGFFSRPIEHVVSELRKITTAT